MCETRAVLLSVAGVIAGAVVVLLIVSGIFALGFGIDTVHNVDYACYGVDIYKTYSTADLTKVYEPGVYSTGVAHYFACLPKLLRNIDFTGDQAIAIRTKEGIEMTVDVSVQYRVLKENVIEVFKLYGTKYEEFAVRTLRNVMRNICSELALDLYIVNRTYVSDYVSSNVKMQMAEKTKLDIYATDLRRFYFPTTIIEISSRAEIAKREQEVSVQERNAELVKLESARVTAAYKAETDLQLLELTQKVAVQDAQNKVILKELEAQAAAKQALVAAQNNAAITVLQAAAKVNASIVELNGEAQKVAIKVQIANAEAENQAKIELLMGKTRADIKSTLAQAEANATVNSLNSKALGLTYVRDNLQFNATELLGMLWIDAVQNLNDTSFMFSYNVPTSLFKMMNQSP